MTVPFTAWVGVGAMIAAGGASLIVTGSAVGSVGLQIAGFGIMAISLWRAMIAQNRYEDMVRQREEQLAAIWNEIEKEPDDE